MKSTRLIAMLLVFALLLSGCGKLIPARTTNPTEASVPETEAAPEETAPAPLGQSDQASMMDQYREILTRLYEEHIWPDGMECEVDETFGDFENNTFTLADVDADGTEELIINYSTTYTAGMLGVVYGFDRETGKVKEELREFPAMNFYPGLIQADWSHNQSMSLDFWPYTLYQYNADSGMYTMIAAVEGWQKANFPQDYDGQDFPTDVDTENKGIVYRVSGGGERKILNQSDYDAWIAEIIGDRQRIQFTWKNLNMTDIQTVK